MKIGFIGLGLMGAGIARNLLKAGHEVVAWNRSPGPLEAFIGDGGTAAAQIADTMQGEIVFSMLSNDAALEENGLAGPLLTAAAPGLVHINMATISLPMARRLAEAHAKAGIGYLACPVFGRPDAAAAAKLQLIVGGDAALIERVRPVLEPLGIKFVIAGNKPEQANLFKIAGNFMIGSTIETFGEAFALLGKAGMAPADFFAVMTDLYFSGAIHKNYGKIIVDQAYDPPGFKLRHGAKDLGLALEAAKMLQAPMPLASLVHDHCLEAMAAGLSEKDWAMVADLAARKAGLK